MFHIICWQSSKSQQINKRIYPSPWKKNEFFKSFNLFLSQTIQVLIPYGLAFTNIGSDQLLFPAYVIAASCTVYTFAPDSVVILYELYLVLAYTMFPVVFDTAWTLYSKTFLIGSQWSLKNWNPCSTDTSCGAGGVPKKEIKSISPKVFYIQPVKKTFASYRKSKPFFSKVLGLHPTNSLKKNSITGFLSWTLQDISEKYL